LRILCCEQETREQLKVFDALPILISLLSTRNVRLQWHLAWTLAQLAEDADTAGEMGTMGLISLLHVELADCAKLTEATDTAQLNDRCAMLTGK
jgi:NIMA (never in mitosis gene a)-related kinase